MIKLCNTKLIQNVILVKQVNRKCQTDMYCAHDQLTVDIAWTSPLVIWSCLMCFTISNWAALIFGMFLSAIIFNCKKVKKRHCYITITSWRTIFHEVQQMFIILIQCFPKCVRKRIWGVHGKTETTNKNFPESCLLWDELWHKDNWTNASLLTWPWNNLMFVLLPVLLYKEIICNDGS
jgi:hypothetical protein